MKTLLTDAQAAQYLFRCGKTKRVVHTVTVRKWADSGRIEKVTVHTGALGRPKVKYPLESLRQFTPPTPGARKGRKRKQEKM